MAEVRLLEQAIGWAPRTVPDLPDHHVRLPAHAEAEVAPHGGPFQYRSCETDVLGLDLRSGEPASACPS